MQVQSKLLNHLQLREEEQQLREAAETKVSELETELERLRAQLTNTKNESA